MELTDSVSSLGLAAGLRSYQLSGQLIAQFNEINKKEKIRQGIELSVCEGLGSILSAEKEGMGMEQKDQACLGLDYSTLWASFGPFLSCCAYSAIHNSSEIHLFH